VPDPAEAPLDEDDGEPVWIDHTDSLRTFRWMLTAALVLGGTLVLLVFLLIVFPESG
jgi:hypothetical protein